MKVGDVVKCIRAEGTLALVEDGFYTIREVRAITIKLDGCPTWFRKDRFELPPAEEAVVPARGRGVRVQFAAHDDVVDAMPQVVWEPKFAEIDADFLRNHAERILHFRALDNHWFSAGEVRVGDLVVIMDNDPVNYGGRVGEPNVGTAAIVTTERSIDGWRVRTGPTHRDLSRVFDKNMDRDKGNILVDKVRCRRVAQLMYQDGRPVYWMFSNGVRLNVPLNWAAVNPNLPAYIQTACKVFYNAYLAEVGWPGAPVAEGKEEKKPVDLKPLWENALKKLTEADDVGCCSYIMMSTTGVVKDHIKDVCHARFYMTTTVAHAAMSIDYRKKCKYYGPGADYDDVVEQEYIQWMLNDSPFAIAFLTKDAKKALEQGYVEFDVEQANAVVFSAAVALRGFYEFAQQWEAWPVFRKAGVAVEHCWVASLLFNKTGDYTGTTNGHRTWGSHLPHGTIQSFMKNGFVKGVLEDIKFKSSRTTAGCERHIQKSPAGNLKKDVDNFFRTHPLVNTEMDGWANVSKAKLENIKQVMEDFYV